jgi:cytochrome c biogenesis protein CcdA
MISALPPHRDMLRTLSIVISIALADSLNASTIGPALVLAAGEHPRRSVLAFALGVIAVFFLGGALIVLGPGRALLALVPHPRATARDILETVVGIALITGALLSRRRSLTHLAHLGSDDHEARGQAGESGEHGSGDGRQCPQGGEQASNDRPRAQRQRSSALLGAGIAAVELPTAFPYFAAIATILSSHLHLWVKLLLVAVYDVCFVLPLFAIILVLTVAGESATRTLDRIRDQLQARGPALARGLAIIAGMYVTALGVTGLASGVPGRAGRVYRRIHHVISK